MNKGFKTLLASPALIWAKQWLVFCVGDSCAQSSQRAWEGSIPKAVHWCYKREVSLPICTPLGDEWIFLLENQTCSHDFRQLLGDALLTLLVSVGSQHPGPARAPESVSAALSEVVAPGCILGQSSASIHQPSLCSLLG